MAKAHGLLINTQRTTTSGKLKLPEDEIASCSAVVEDSKLIITIEFNDASFDEHDTDIDKNQVLLLSTDKGIVKVVKTAGFAKFAKNNPTSPKFEDVVITFELNAPKSGKVGGPGVKSAKPAKKTAKKK